MLFLLSLEIEEIIGVLLVLVIGILLAFHGARLPPEDRIRALAHATHMVSGACLLE
jgi:hypothetical protein